MEGGEPDSLFPEASGKYPEEVTFELRLGGAEDMWWEAFQEEQIAHGKAKWCRKTSLVLGVLRRSVWLETH